MNVDLSIISDDDFNCYGVKGRQTVHTNIEGELQIYPREFNLTAETGITYGQTPTEPNVSVRESKRQNK